MDGVTNYKPEDIKLEVDSYSKASSRRILSVPYF